MDATTRQLLKLGGLGLAACWGVKAAVRRSRRFDMRGKVAVVTGGSRGLGLVLSRQLVDAGVRVAICARTEEDLATAEEELRARGGDVMAIRCDIRDQKAVEAMIDQVLARWGTIDLLFNVAGIVQVGPLDAMTMDDFHQAMDTHCWGSLHTVLAVLPTMRQKRWGRIVNITSVGGKQAIPHMLPYAASKFAQVGLSNGLRTELSKDGIFVTTACPSLMRTGSPRNAIFKSQHRKEFAWFSIGAAMPIASMDAEKAAQQILRACQNGDGEVLITNNLNLGMYLQSLAPHTARDLSRLVNLILPETGGIGRQPVRGYDSHSSVSPSFVTRPNERAAVHNNEMRAHPIDQ